MNCLNFVLEVRFVVFLYVNIFLRLVLDIVLPSVVFLLIGLYDILVKSLHMFKKKREKRIKLHDYLKWL